jgi:hypothetical protein
MKPMKLAVLRNFVPTLITIAIMASCHCPKPKKIGSTISVANQTDGEATVYVSFGSNSVVLPANWSFCVATSNLTCSFKLPASKSQDLPLAGKYLNATISFDAGVGCGSTKAEININNPNWYDILDVSLVDGYSNKISITTGTTTLGPPAGRDENEKIFGVFPYGCDICVARQSPPCGIPTGNNGCKTGTQYKPDVPCQYQGPTIGGGSSINVALVK